MKNCNAIKLFNVCLSALIGFFCIQNYLSAQIPLNELNNLAININKASEKQRMKDAEIFAAYSQVPYIPNKLDPTLTFSAAQERLRFIIKKFLLKRGKQAAYYNEETKQSFNHVRNVVVTDEYLMFTKNGPKIASDTVIMYYKDILNTPVIYFTPFRNGVSCYTKVKGHVFGSAIRELPDVIYAIQYHYSIQYYKKEIENFKEDAIKYQSLAEKPAIDEEQRKLFVQAKAKAENGKYYEAIELYQKGIAYSKFSYTGAYYNLALIASLAEYYPYAIYCMKQYLLLEPNVTDKQDAQDKIYVWEANIK